MNLAGLLTADWKLMSSTYIFPKLLILLVMRNFYQSFVPLELVVLCWSGLQVISLARVARSMVSANQR